MPSASWPDLIAKCYEDGLDLSAKYMYVAYLVLILRRCLHDTGMKMACDFIPRIHVRLSFRYDLRFPLMRLDENCACTSRSSLPRARLFKSRVTLSRG